MTPLELGILLHYVGGATDYRGGDFSAPAVREAIDRFHLHESLLKPISAEERGFATYKLTDRGHAFIEALCAMPLPKCKWVIPKHNVEEEG